MRSSERAMFVRDERSVVAVSMSMVMTMLMLVAMIFRTIMAVPVMLFRMIVALMVGAILKLAGSHG